jgi:hypothetical protein
MCPIGKKAEAMESFAAPLPGGRWLPFKHSYAIRFDVLEYILKNIFVLSNKGLSNMGGLRIAPGITFGGMNFRRVERPGPGAAGIAPGRLVCVAPAVG